jgi:hypothetical protein
VRACDAVVAERFGDASSPVLTSKPNGALKMSRDGGVASALGGAAPQPRATATASFQLSSDLKEARSAWPVETLSQFIGSLCCNFNVVVLEMRIGNARREEFERPRRSGKSSRASVSFGVSKPVSKSRTRKSSKL